MGKLYNFFLDPVGNQNCESEANELCEILQKVGVTTKIDVGDDGYRTLVIEVDEYRFKQVTDQNNRNAGRKRKIDKLGDMEAQKFIDKFKELGVKGITEEYGLERSTAYKYLKMAKAAKPYDKYWMQKSII